MQQLWGMKQSQLASVSWVLNVAVCEKASWRFSSRFTAATIRKLKRGVGKPQKAIYMDYLVLQGHFRISASQAADKLGQIHFKNPRQGWVKIVETCSALNNSQVILVTPMNFAFLESWYQEVSEMERIWPVGCLVPEILVKNFKIENHSFKKSGPIIFESPFLRSSFVSYSEPPKYFTTPHFIFKLF